MIWHGSSEAGERMEDGACDGWRNSSDSVFGRASAFGAGMNFMRNPIDVGCSKRLAVLCVEVSTMGSVPSLHLNSFSNSNFCDLAKSQSFVEFWVFRCFSRFCSSFSS